MRAILSVLILLLSTTIGAWQFAASFPIGSVATWLLLLSLSWLILRRLSVRAEVETFSTRPSVILLILVVLLAIASRLPHLTEIPPRFDPDEARQGRHALYLLSCIATDSDCSANLFGLGWNNLPNASYLPSVAALSVGRAANADYLWSARISSVVTGVAAVGIFYILICSLGWGNAAAFWGGTLLACSRSSVEWSRLATSNIQTQVLLGLFLLMLSQALRHKRHSDWFLFGCISASGAYSYHAAKIQIILGPIFFLFFNCFRQKEDNRFAVLVSFFAGWLAVLLPALLAQIDASFRGVLLNDRTLQDDFANLIFAGRWEELLQFLGLQIRESLLGIFLHDGSMPFGYPGPLLDPVTSAICLVGMLGLVFFGSAAERFILISSLLAIVVIGGVMTINPLHHPRLLGLTLVLITLASFSLSSGHRLIWGRKMPTLILMIMVVTANAYNLMNELIELPKIQSAEHDSVSAARFGAEVRNLRQKVGPGTVFFSGRPTLEQEYFALSFYNILPMPDPNCGASLKRAAAVIIEHSMPDCLGYPNCESTIGCERGGQYICFRGCFR